MNKFETKKCKVCGREDVVYNVDEDGCETCKAPGYDPEMHKKVPKK